MQQKRVLLCGEWVEQNVLEPMAQRQYVFTLPKLLRTIFSRHRARLRLPERGKSQPLCRCDAFSYPLFFGRVLGLPAHRRVDALEAARMIEKDQFLDVARHELAVFAELQSRFGESIGFA